jgi:hypothetical protein
LARTFLALARALVQALVRALVLQTRAMAAALSLAAA